MALKYNSITVIGRATRDAEMTYTQDGTARTKLSVAYNHSVREGDGWRDEPTFFNVVCFRDQAERAAQQVKRGSIVLVEGRMSMRKYTAQDGTERQAWEIVANLVRTDLAGGQSTAPTDDFDEAETPTPTPMRTAAPAGRGTAYNNNNSGSGRGSRNAPPPPSDDPDDLPF